MSKELVFGIGVFMISFFMRTVVDNYDKEGRINDILNGWIGDIMEVIFELIGFIGCIISLWALLL